MEFKPKAGPDIMRDPKAAKAIEEALSNVLGEGDRCVCVHATAWVRWCVNKCVCVCVCVCVCLQDGDAVTSSKTVALSSSRPSMLAKTNF